MGDPCGIGPETIVRAVAAGATGPALVVGDVAVMRRAVAQCDLLLPVARLDAPGDALAAPPDCLLVWQPPGLAPVNGFQLDFFRVHSFTQDVIHLTAHHAKTPCCHRKLLHLLQRLMARAVL